MVIITSTTLGDLMNLTLNFSWEKAERIIDLAIDMLNLYGAELPNMSGVSGSKTVEVTSPQKAAIMLVARAIFYSFMGDPGAWSDSDQTISTSDLLVNTTVLSTVKEAAHILKEPEGRLG